MKIGVVRFSSIGDIVLTTPLIRVIKENIKNAEIIFLTKREYSELLSTNPNISKIISFDEGNFTKFLSTVRKEKFDLFIDLHLIPRSILTIGFAQSRKRVFYKKQRLARQFMVNFKMGRPTRHVIDLYLDCLKPFSLKIHNKNPEIFLTQPMENGVKTFLKKNRIKKPVVVIAPGAKRYTKRWEAENFGNLCNLLIERMNTEIFILGSDEDKGVAEDVKSAIRHRVYDLTGRTSLLQTAAFLKECSVLITNDTGPMHIATAVGTPVVAIFGPTVPEFGFAPYGERNRTIQIPLPCRPCSLHGSSECKKGHFKCMRFIKPDDVYDKVVGVL